MNKNVARRVISSAESRKIAPGVPMYISGAPYHHKDENGDDIISDIGFNHVYRCKEGGIAIAVEDTLVYNKTDIRASRETVYKKDPHHSVTSLSESYRRKRSNHLISSKHYGKNPLNFRSKSYFRNGVLKSNKFYRHFLGQNRVIFGRRTGYYSNGNPRMTSFYKVETKGEKVSVANGIVNEYHRNGQPKQRTSVRRGKMAGWMLRYDESGTLKTQKLLRPGEKDVHKGLTQNALSYKDTKVITSIVEEHPDKSMDALYSIASLALPNTYRVLIEDFILELMEKWGLKND